MTMALGGSQVLVRILADDKGLQQTFDETATGADRFAGRMGAAGRRLSTRVTLPLIGAGAALIGLANKQEEAETKLTSTFESMGASAWTSVDALKATASELQGVTTFGDEAIIGLQDLLLTFGNVKNEVGEGNDVFDQATRIGLDMSAALGQDLQSSAIQLGKALNDPIAGITALSRVGVSFTDAQKDTIQALVESGDVMGAQKIILQSLEEQFGGTAEAIAGTDAGKMKQAMNSLGDAGEELGKVLLPVLSELAKWLQALARWFSRLSPGVRRFVVIIGAAAAAIGPLLIVGAKLVKAFQVIGSAFKVLSALMATNPWLLLIAAVVALVVIIVTNWDKIVAVLKKVWGWITEAAGKVGEFLKEAFSKAINFLKDLFTKFTPLGFLIANFDKIREGAEKVREWLGEAFSKAIDWIKRIFTTFSPLGIIISKFDRIKELATGVKDWIVDRFNDMITFMRELPGRVTSAIGDLFGGIRDAFKNAINWIIDRWNSLDLEIGPFSIPSWVPAVGGKSFHIADIFPDLPRLHGGGIFQAPRAGGEGLAVLMDQERILPAPGAPIRPRLDGTAMGGHQGGDIVFAPRIGIVVGPGGERELFERFRKYLYENQRRNGSVGLVSS